MIYRLLSPTKSSIVKESINNFGKRVKDSVTLNSHIWIKFSKLNMKMELLEIEVQ